MIQKNDFKDKVAIVTGSAMGIGKAIAENLYQNGARVVVSDIQVETGEETAAQLGERAIFFPCDISDHEQVNSLVKTTVEYFGKLDIMINNAGVNSIKFEDRVTID